MVLNHQVRELTFKSCSLYNMVVDPVIIAAPGFSEYDAVVFKTMLRQPAFRNTSVGFRPAGEEEYNMAFIVPFIEHSQGIGVG